MMGEIVLALWCGIIGFEIGNRLAARREKARAQADRSPHEKLILQMIETLRDKRRFVGPGPTISTQVQFNILGELITMRLSSDAIEEVEQ